MSLLNTFFIRYRADTGQAIRDIERLTVAEKKEAAARAKQDEARNKAEDEHQKNAEKSVEASKRFGESLGKLGESGSNKLEVLKGAAGALGDVITAIGPAGLAAAVGIGAVIAAIAVANSGIDDARIAAKEAMDLGEKAFDARLAQGELIRLQGQGRVRGISDDDVSQSARGVNDRAAEIRAAQRQAARDPASAFNNPLIKQANLWRKAGVDVAAGLETQITQQDKYLRSLNDAGKHEQALVEGTQLFGRALVDVKSVLSTTQKQMDENALAMAKENQTRRELQTSAENLSTSEGILEAARKRNDERVRRYTVPATDQFTKALTEWERAVGPLKDSWGTFVSALIEGMAKLIGAGTRLGRSVGLLDDDRTATEKMEEKIKDAGDQGAVNYLNSPNRAPAYSDRFKEELAAARKKAEDDARAKYTAEAAVEQNKRTANAPGQTKLAVKDLVVGGMFEGKKIDADKLAEAVKATEESIKNDPTITTLEDIKTVLGEQLAKAKEQGKVQQAQTEYTKKIEANTLALVNTGLEQAMALWAANVGKGAGVGSGSMQGETQIDYEKRVRAMQRTINPNAARKMSMDRAAVGAMSGQAEQLNKAKSASLGNTDQSRTVQIDTLKVEVISQAQDVAGLAQDVGVSIRDELRYAAAEFASPVVS